MRFVLGLAFLFALCISVGDIAHADGAAGAAAAAAAPDPWLPLWMLLAGVCGSVGAIVRKYTPSTGFWHEWYGHVLLVFIGAMLGTIGPMFEAGFVSKATLAAALAGGVSAFLSALKANGKPDPSTLAASSLLPILFVAGVLASGCHGFKAPAYATMSGMAGAAGVAVVELPQVCEKQENAAVDASKSKDEATQKAGAIHAQCTTAAGVLKTLPDGLQTARDAVYNAPQGADLTAVMPWVKLVVGEYCDARPLLSILGYQLPTFPGVCS